jgi:hypothetical protein
LEIFSISWRLSVILPLENKYRFFIVKLKSRVLCSYRAVLSGFNMRTIKKLYNVDRKSVGYIKFIFEAYDGIAVVETIEPDSAVIMLHVAPGCEKDVENVVLELKKSMFMEPTAESVQK